MRVPFPAKKTFSFYGNNLVVVFIVFLTALTPFFTQMNQQILDLVHSWSRIPARSEIVIVGIDDKSLQEIGAWPWDRSIFAQLIDKLNTAKARTIGIDVLFLEKRNGDDQLATALSQSTAPVVLASKLVLEENRIEYPFFQLPAEQFGFINFLPDNDGKVRNTYFPKSEDALYQTSFSFQILNQYFSESFVRDELLSEYPSAQKVFFTYTHQPYTQVSLSDIIHNRVDPTIFKDKIILVGTTTIDLKSGINDSLTDIFGQSAPGIVMHANIINSLLLNRFQHSFTVLTTFLATIFLSLIFSTIFKVVRSNLLDLVFSVGAFIGNALIGFFVFDLGYNWPFFIFGSVILVSYIASLAQKYISENKQKRFIQMAFSQYMNPALMRQLMANPDQLKLGGEKKVMTVMFSDVRGFTSLSEKVAPEKLFSLLNEYLDHMCDIVISQRGTIDKFIGDAIMALWNAPLDDPNHHLNAIKAAMMMEEALDSFNKAHPDTHFNIGIGINTGEMVVGNIGSKQRFDYTVLGDNVNLASRIEGLTKKYGIRILLTQSTIEDIKDSNIIFRKIDQVIVKGKTKAICLCQPLHNTEGNAKLKKEYEAAFELYAQGEFKKAKKIWESLPDDPPSQMMLERLKELKDVKDWKGVWEWHEK